MKKYEKNAWLLIKKKDKYASTDDILLKDKSVISGETIEEFKAEGKTQKEKIPDGKNS